MKIQSFFNKWWIEEEAFRDYSALVFDIDGTLIAGRTPLSGAKELIDWLHENKYPFYLLTNDGNHSPEEKSATMRKAGLSILPEDIISCGSAITLFSEKNKLKGKKFFVMGDLGVPCYAEKAGLVVERDTKKILSCEGVIVGEGSYDWMSNFSAATNFFIKKPNAYLLVPNPDSYWPNGLSGEIGIGAGGKARFLCSILHEYGIKLKPVYFGKPYPTIFKYAFKMLKGKHSLPVNTKKKKVLMLGDSLRADIRGANNFGFSTALLLTGITKREHLARMKGVYRPDMVFEGLR